MATYRVYRPTYDDAHAPTSDRLADRDGTIDGKRIGLLWNAKVNADIYLQRLKELIGERHSDVQFIERAKPTASKPMEPEVLEDMLACDLVVTAFGD